MAKKGRNQKKTDKRSSRGQFINPEDMDDEIDAFHKKRDIIPLDINADDQESSEDEEEPVFDYEDINNDDDDNSDDEDGGDDAEEDEDEKGFAAKIIRQRKYIQEKYGAIDDEMHDKEEENEEDKKNVWGGRKGQYYGGQDYEMDSSDDEALKAEEEEILRMRREKSDVYNLEDFGVENVDEDESDKELTLEEISVKGKSKIKDLNALSREEQMDVVYSAAPELVGLLSELNDAIEQLERVNPILVKVKTGGSIRDGGLRYLEVLQLLLLAYCQAITFYLLLKSEGQPVRDHPVIARLVEIKGLLDKMKQLDGSLLLQLEEVLKKNHWAETGENKVAENATPALASESVNKYLSSSLSTAKADAQELAELGGTLELVKAKSSKDQDNKENKHKHKIDQVGIQSMEMLKVRAALEEKLKQKGVFSSFAPKLDKAQKYKTSINGQLETHDDFDDDAINVERGNHGSSNGNVSSLGSNKLSQLVSAKPNRPKVVSGDDDLPKRDDIGERRRKHELRVLAGAGVKSEDDAMHELGKPESDYASDIEEDGIEEASEDEFYKEIKQKREVKVAGKAKIYSRTAAVPSLPETVDGKRQINRQIEKNRGLTRPRKKDLKNPRKKYRTKHDKQKKRRQGQVQQIRKPTGPYGGEVSGINAAISRSIRF